MSSRRLDKPVFLPVVIDSRRTHLTLAPDKVRLRKNGIEFLSPVALNPWVEMTVELESPRSGSRVRCTGIVVACDGNRHAGYSITMLFTGLNRQMQAQLDQLAFSGLA